MEEYLRRYEQTRRYAHIAYGACASLTLVLCLFIGVVVGLSIPDEVLGPVVSVLLLLGIFLSLLLGVIHSIRGSRMKRHLRREYGIEPHGGKTQKQQDSKLLRCISSLLCVCYFVLFSLKLCLWLFADRGNGRDVLFSGVLWFTMTVIVILACIFRKNKQTGTK